MSDIIRNDHIIYIDHSIYFEKNGSVRNTYSDFRLIPTSRPIIKRPDVKTNYVEIPGADGVLDYTEALNGLKYNNRKGSWEFTRYNKENATETEWANDYSDLLAYFHGQKFDKIYLHDDLKPDGTPACFYRGRVEVNDWKSDAQFSQITLDYNLEPYKEEIGEDSDSSTAWIWDDLFNGESVSPIMYGRFTVYKTKCRGIVNNHNSDMPVTIRSTTSCLCDNLTTAQSNIQIPSGQTRIMVPPGKTILKFKGQSTITMYYNGGGLVL